MALCTAFGANDAGEPPTGFVAGFGLIGFSPKSNRSAIGLDPLDMGGHGIVDRGIGDAIRIDRRRIEIGQLLGDLHDLVVPILAMKHRHQARALLGPIAGPTLRIVVSIIIDSLVALESGRLDDFLDPFAAQLKVGALAYPKGIIYLSPDPLKSHGSAR